MNDIVIWVALIGVIGTLLGVCLGNWQQSRNIRQQRKWILQDQKREWTRNRRQEEFRRIQAFVDGTLEQVLKMEGMFKLGLKKQLDESFLKYKELTASAMPVIFMTMGEDGELANLLVEFEKKKNEAFDALLANNQSQVDSSGKRIAELAGLIRKHTEKLLEKTFD